MNKYNISAQLKQDEGDSKKYEIEVICNNEVYTNKMNSSHLPDLYYIIFQKSYLEKENT